MEQHGLIYITNRVSEKNIITIKIMPFSLTVSSIRLTESDALYRLKEIEYFKRKAKQSVEHLVHSKRFCFDVVMRSKMDWLNLDFDED